MTVADNIEPAPGDLSEMCLNARGHYFVVWLKAVGGVPYAEVSIPHGAITLAMARDLSRVLAWAATAADHVADADPDPEPEAKPCPE